MQAKKEAMIDLYRYLCIWSESQWIPREASMPDNAATRCAEGVIGTIDANGTQLLS